GWSTRRGRVVDEVPDRIDGPTLEPQFEVKVWPGGGPGAPNVSDDVTLPHEFTRRHGDAAQVCVARLAVVAVVECDGVAVRAPPTGPLDDAAAGSPNRRPPRSRQVDTCMVAVTVDRHVAPTEVRTDPGLDRSDERLRSHVEVAEGGKDDGERAQLSVSQRLSARGLLRHGERTERKAHDRSERRRDAGCGHGAAPGRGR